MSKTLDITWIREKVRTGRYQISEHVIRFLMARLLTVPEIETAIETGEVVESQTVSHRPASVLIQGRVHDQTLFSRCSIEWDGESTDWLIISLAYLSDQPKWPELSWTQPGGGLQMDNPFRKCFFCGGQVKAITVGNFDYRLDGSLYVIKGTPAGLCLQCGEKYLTAETAHRINALIAAGRFSSTESVRVMAFSPEP